MNKDPLATNAHYVKIGGSHFELSGKLTDNKQHVFQGAGEVVNVVRHTNQDGTYRFVYTLEPKFLDVREAENEISAPDELKVKRNFNSKMTMSQELRWEIGLLWEAMGSMGDKEDFYRAEMNKLITKVQARREMLK